MQVSHSSKLSLHQVGNLPLTNFATMFYVQSLLCNLKKWQVFASPSLRSVSDESLNLSFLCVSLLVYFLNIYLHRLWIFKQRFWLLKSWPSRYVGAWKASPFLSMPWISSDALGRRLNVSRILPFVILELIEENVKSSSLAKWKRSGCVVTEQLPRASLKIELWIYRCDFLAVSLSP